MKVPIILQAYSSAILFFYQLLEPKIHFLFESSFFKAHLIHL